MQPVVTETAASIIPANMNFRILLLPERQESLTSRWQNANAKRLVPFSIGMIERLNLSSLIIDVVGSLTRNG